MHIPRVYLPQPLATGATLILSEQAAHHVTHVLRLRPGTLLTVFDGQGCEHEATLRDIQRSKVTIDVEKETASNTESSLSITLAQGIPRGARMDFILQKAVELGVSGIQPLWMQRSQSRATGERLEKRLRHWQGVVINACEQSGRSTLPWLGTPTDYQSWLNAGPSCDYRILLHPKGEYTLGKLEPPQEAILLLVGPEGGISNAEHNLAAQAGFASVRLGPRILRTETAAMAAIASLQALWGDCC